MSKGIRFFTLLLLLVPSLLVAQQKDTLTNKLDSLNKRTDSLGQKQINNTNPEAYNEGTKITFGNYFVLLTNDFKQQITSPFRATQKDWLKIGAFGLFTTACVLFVDKPANELTMNIKNSSNTVYSTSGYITRFGGAYGAYTLGALAAYGYIFKKEKTKTTTFLATQAYITAGAIEIATKFLTGRQRPFYYNPVTGTNSPTWHGPFYQFTKDKNGMKPPSSSYTSFPSGHTTVAFAIATVFAMEYKDSRFVPIIAYSAASLVGISRLIENQHWFTDVLVGAVLGYLCGRQVVNNYHRYSKILSAKKKGTVVATLNYFQGTLLPGFVYTFR
jgi:membrane-associated phospholipid phosphatase